MNKTLVNTNQLTLWMLTKSVIGKKSDAHDSKDASRFNSKKETTFDHSLLQLFGQAKFVFGQVFIIFTCQMDKWAKKLMLSPVTVL